MITIEKSSVGEMISQVRISWVHDLNGILGLEDKWRSLESRVVNRTPASSFDWVVPWYRHYGEMYGRPMLGIAELDEDIIGIAPLVARKSTLATVPVLGAEFAGFNAESGELLILDGMEDLVSSFLQSLLDDQGVDVIMLNGFEAESRELSIVEKFIDANRLRHGIVNDRYALVDLQDGYDAYFGKLTSKLRNSYNRHKRRITEAGEWEVEQVDGFVDEAVALDAMKRLFAVYRNSWKASESEELAEPHRSFYIEIARKFASQGMMKVCFLKLDNEDIAFMFWLVDRNRCFDVKVSYDERFARLSPGILLMHETLKLLAIENIHTVISHGDRSYKKNWASAFVTRYRIFVFNSGFRSKLSYALKFKLRPWIKKIVSRLRH